MSLSYNNVMSILYMDNIDILIYSAPKTAGNTLQTNLTEAGYKVYYTHDTFFFSAPFPGQNNNMSLKEYIKKESNSKKLIIIMIYREFVERIISLFFQSFKYFYKLDQNETIDNVPIDKLIKFFNNNVLINYINKNNYNNNITDGFFELFPDQTKAFIDNYNISNDYSTWNKDNIQFVVLNYHNIKNWESNLIQIFGKKISLNVSVNTSEKKDYSDTYNNFKNKYILPKHLSNEIFEINGYPTLFNYCLSYHKKMEFFKKYDINKTLIGKEGYLFLNNDSNRELTIHNDNVCSIKETSLNRYDNYKNKMIFITFPDKSFLCKDFLPEIYKPIYRPSFNIYNNYFKEKLIDGAEILKGIKNVFYKTDSHTNLTGAYAIYCSLIEKAKLLFNIDLNKKDIHIEKKIVKSLNELNLGLGDLTWEINLGKQILDTTEDIYYYSNDLCDIYLRYKFKGMINYVFFY